MDLQRGPATEVNSTEYDTSDEEIVARIRAGDLAAFESLMRRNNRRLYRTARAIVQDDAEAEDVLQDAYINAFRHLDSFEGRARLSTWLTRIVVREGLARLRQRRSDERHLPLAENSDEDPMSNVAGTDRNPEQHASGEELRRVLEDAIDTLPENFRTVFVLRSVEDLSVAETASCLEIPEETVKTRLYRARGLLRDALVRRGEEALVDAFSFEAPRCNRVVENVLRRIRAGEG